MGFLINIEMSLVKGWLIIPFKFCQMIPAVNWQINQKPGDHAIRQTVLHGTLALGLKYAHKCDRHHNHLYIYYIQCSVTCGEGVRTRNVHCRLPSGEETIGCFSQSKPSTSSSCQGPPCTSNFYNCIEVYYEK